MKQDMYEGYTNVLEFGAQPNSFRDDTEAFKQAVASSGSVFVPGGIYYVSEPIVLNNQNFVGSGMMATQIISLCPDPAQPIILAGRSCVISDLTIAYKEGFITGAEQRGERVGISTRGETWCLQRGSTIRNVRIEETGTALYSADEHDVYGGPFSTLFESLELVNFSFRGIDFSTYCRTGNVFTNLYMYSKKPHVDACIHLSGEDSEVVFHQLNMEETICRNAMQLFDVRGLQISTVHLQGIEISEPGQAMITMHNSTGTIGTISFYYCPLNHRDISLFEIGDSVYDIRKSWAMNYPETLNLLHINNLHVKGLNDPTVHEEGRIYGLNDFQDGGFYFFRRGSDARGDYYVEVDQYSWYSFKDDQNVYETMPRDPFGRISFTRLGQLPAGGSTDKRPRFRQCAFTTRYFDTDLGREVIWDGTHWR